MSRFMANRPISVSMAKPSVTVAGADLLVVPDDLVERERDLLLGLELDDVGDLLLFDRRQLDEAGQAGLAGDADGDLVALDRVAREELLQRLAGELVGVGVGLGEDLGVLDVVEGGGGDGLPSISSSRRALRAHWPMSMPQTPGLTAMRGRLRGREDDTDNGGAANGPPTGAGWRRGIATDWERLPRRRADCQSS